jgi:hypothetical protein
MTLTAITPAEFAQRRWQPPQNLNFARNRGLIEIAAAELPAAACTLPIGFLPRDDDTVVPVALLGIEETRSLFVARNGTWLGGYIPAALRAAPFALGVTESGEKVLCIDDSVQWAQGEAGSAFFDDQGTPSAALLQAHAFVGQIESNRAATALACAQLQGAGLLTPWPIVIPLKDGARNIQGLQCIDEAALNGLPAATLHGMLGTGALAMAYCQLIAMQHTAKLGELADAHAALEHAPATQPSQSRAGHALDLSFLNQDGTLSFGNE